MQMLARAGPNNGPVQGAVQAPILLKVDGLGSSRAQAGASATFGVAVANARLHGLFAPCPALCYEGDTMSVSQQSFVCFCQAVIGSICTSLLWCLAQKRDPGQSAGCCSSSTSLLRASSNPCLALSANLLRIRALLEMLSSRHDM